MRRKIASSLVALALAGCSHLTVAAEPTDAQLVQIVRDYAAKGPKPYDPAAGAQIEIERTAREWIVSFTRQLPATSIGGDSASYVIDKATRRVSHVIISQ